jgi:hypothetical protein
MGERLVSHMAPPQNAGPITMNLTETGKLIRQATGGSHGELNTEKGPQLIIRNPHWNTVNNWQPIPIMVFTLSQWNALQLGKFLVSAAPIPPAELGRNSNYVLALPPRYNYAFTTGWQEVEKILESKPLHAF